jgi:O-antigen/teichoic acid export membrane protein
LLPFISGAFLSARREKLVRFASRFLQFTLVQILVMLAGMVVSLMLVRSMPKAEYAYYTIANGLLSTILALSDSGLAAGVQAIGGPFYRDDHRMGELVQTGISMRRRMYFLAIGLVLPFIPYMLWKSGAKIAVILEVVVMVILTTQFQLMISVLSAVPRLRGKTRLLQWVSGASVIARMLILVPAYFLHMSLTVALFALLAANVVQVWILNRWSKSFIDMAAPPSPEMRSRIWNIVKLQLPYELYGIVQGQISLWLITIFGSASKVADLGAVSRVSLIFAIIPQVLNVILTPRVSRCDDARKLRAIYWQVFLGFVLFTIACMAPVFAKPDLVIRMLGSQYSDIRPDLFLCVFLYAIWSLQGAALGLNMSRGWVVPAYFGITATIITQVFTFTMLNLSTLHGVLLSGVYVAFISFLIQIVGSEYFIRKSLREQQMQEATA